MARFKDSRLYDFWTKTGINETIWFDTGFGTFERINREQTPWMMGNK